MILRSKEKKERALGVKLFLKGERCNSPKCAMVRRAYRPGMHGKKRRRGISEYATQLAEKQKIRFTYGLNERRLKKIFDNISSKKGATGEMILSILERHLANVIFRLGLASSRIVARQLVSHGHISVNNKKVTIQSYLVKVGDVVSISPRSQELLIFKNLKNIIKSYQPPDWLVLDKEKMEGRVRILPYSTEIPFDINLMVDYYSK